MRLTHENVLTVGVNMYAWLKVSAHLGYRGYKAVNRSLIILMD